MVVDDVVVAVVDDDFVAVRLADVLLDLPGGGGADWGPRTLLLYLASTQLFLRFFYIFVFLNL